MQRQMSNARLLGNSGLHWLWPWEIRTPTLNLWLTESLGTDFE